MGRCVGKKGIRQCINGGGVGVRGEGHLGSHYSNLEEEEQRQISLYFMGMKQMKAGA